MRLESAIQYQTAARQQLVDAAELVAHPTEDAFGPDAHERHLMGAMYLAGYAVECGLKEYLIRKYGTATNGVVPPPGLSVTFDLIVPVLERMPVLRFNWRQHSHDLDKLWEAACFPAPGVDTLSNLGICREWNVEWRYTPPRGKTRQAAEEFVQAAHELTDWVFAQP